MSTENEPPLEETSVPTSPQPRGEGRGYFFYIAVFFILIALLCYLLNSSGINLSLPVPSTPTPATPTSPH